jgi:predicted porin
MKRLNKTVGFAAAILIANAAHAQNSVTMYGIIDNGLMYVHNSGGQSSQWRMSGGGNVAGTRWGFKGREDLGGGLAALFVLENGFNTATGTLNQGGREFGRQAYVGL